MSNQRNNQELDKLQEAAVKYDKLAKLKRGTIVLATNGDEVEFIALKRKNFQGTSKKDGKTYNYPVAMFVKVISEPKVDPSKVEEWKNLQEGELFYINHKNNALLFKFEKLVQRRNKIVIQGINISNKIPTDIDTSLYGGKVSDL